VDITPNLQLFDLDENRQRGLPNSLATRQARVPTVVAEDVVFTFSNDMRKVGDAVGKED